MSLYCGSARQEPQYQFNNYEQEKRHENRSPHIARTLFIFAFVAATTTSVQALTRYEYKVIQVDKANVANNQQLELLLNQLGQEGWLLIETSPSGTAIFQREK